LNNRNISSELSEALDSHSILEHPNNCLNIPSEKSEALDSQPIWNIQRFFEGLENFFWKIRGTRLTAYVRTCKCCLSDQNILYEKSEALNLQSVLECTKFFWVIRIFFLRNKRHWTHPLYWNMQRLFETSDIPAVKSEALVLPTMWKHTKIVCVIRTLFLRNKRHLTHSLCWNMQRLFEWSEYLFWKIRNTRLTAYVRTYNSCLSGQNIFPEK